jgi:hypothetical protein
LNSGSTLRNAASVAPAGATIGNAKNVSVGSIRLGDFPRNCFVRGVCLHLSVVASLYPVCTAELRDSGLFRSRALG